MSNNYKLTIGVCSVLGRGTTFLPKILSQLQDQIKGYETQVELICLLDNKSIMLGEKRNMIVNMAIGEYITFVDDDDRLSDNYIQTLVNTIDNNKDIDCITFIVDVSINKGMYIPCYYSKDYLKDFNEPKAYRRIPNHICCVKTSIAKETPYQNILRGEDAAYAKDLLPKLSTEVMIDEVLYYYDFNIETTETQQIIKRK